MNSSPRRIATSCRAFSVSDMATVMRKDDWEKRGKDMPGGRGCQSNMDAPLAFRLENTHPLSRRSIGSLLSRQNSDGSWGDCKTDMDYEGTPHPSNRSA